MTTRSESASRILVRYLVSRTGSFFELRWTGTHHRRLFYEIPLNRHFYRYEPPRPLDVIEKDIKRLESEILDPLKEVTS